jgi:hypothetical protein
MQLFGGEILASTFFHQKFGEVLCHLFYDKWPFRMEEYMGVSAFSLCYYWSLSWY